ncbi:MAG: HAD-IA family hydrolase [Fimbriimonas sp.]
MTLTAAGFLFDLDGTLLDSIAVVDRAWSAWAELRGFDPAEVLTKIHGRRSIDSLRLMFPQFDPEEEDLVIRRIECEMSEGVAPIPGAMEFLAQVPLDRWALVTSGTSDVALSRVVASGMAVPPKAVFGEDVRNGKPAPDPYLRGAELLGLAPQDCIVFEDTVAGVRSGKAAGMRVVGVGELDEAGVWVRDYYQLNLQVTEDGLHLLVQH